MKKARSMPSILRGQPTVIEKMGIDDENRYVTP